MTPKKVLLFTLSSLFVLLLLSIVFPTDGIKINHNITLKFITIEELINPPEQNKVDISNIINGTDIKEITDTVSFTDEKDEKENFDSVMIDSQYIYYKPMPVKIDSVVRYIDFPDNTRSSLDNFFKILANIKNERQIIRIMHYGDSQIETDRITDYFRYKLQTQFGGSGPGIVPAVKAFNFKSPMIQSVSGNWKRYTIYGRRDTTVKHRRYGMTGNFARFTPILADTVPDSLKTFTQTELMPHNLTSYASINISQSPYSFRPTKKFKRCKMFYGYNTSDVKIKTYADEQLIDESILPPVQDYKIKTWNFETTPQNIRFEFEAEDSPDIYGFSLEGYSGINVDNIGMRGSGGLFFTRMDLGMLSRMYKQLNVKLLILQFGGNIVPNVRENYDYYRKAFSRQLRTLKRIAPDVTIMVIGLADMSKKENDIYVTYPNVPLIRDALKQASFENNCAYWDMYEAMGGENSMPSWVFYEPPLAEKDFIHFTPKGARYIAKMFYNAFMYEYNRYLRKNK